MQYSSKFDILVAAIVFWCSSATAAAASCAPQDSSDDSLAVRLVATSAAVVSLANIGSLSDDESETEKLVARAQQLTNLTSFDGAPFSLRVSLFFNDPSGDSRIPPAQGSYSLIWKSPEKWREDVDLLHLKQTEIANVNALWTKRNAPYPSLSYWRTQRALAILHGLTYQFDSRTHIEISQISGRNIVCAKNGGIRLTQELCLDTRTALPLLLYDSTLRLQFVYGDWTQWQNHWYPHTIQGFADSQLVMHVEVTRITDAPPESKWIAPPPESTRRDWCADMRAARVSDAVDNIALPDINPGAIPAPGANSSAAANPNPAAQSAPVVGAVAYVLIGKDGSWLDMSVLDSSDFKAAFKMLERLHQFPNQPATCHGSPVESETIFRISPQPR